MSAGVAVSQQLRERIVTELGRARWRTLSLLDPLTDDELERQHSPLQSPLVWDLAHIGHFEELWLVRRLGGEEQLGREFDDVYDAFAHARGERSSLPLLRPDSARAYVAAVRERALRLLEEADLASEDPLLAGGFVYGMVAQHELQHVETMLATLQLSGIEYPDPPAGPPPAESSGELEVGAGPFVLGTDSEPWAYDNEREAHTVDLAGFVIDSAPVTNARFSDFVEAGGYADRRLWTEEGWAWRNQAGAEHPQFWLGGAGGGWERVRLGRREPLPSTEPVQHVCWYEAAAFARWDGKRLPTEPEWEKAASTRAIAAPAGVWEWTSSDFGPYPGFRAFPYPEYSEVFFGGEYKVLRGGSWATDSVLARRTFRNWDFPIRRQIFAGLRCARDL